MLSSAVFVGLWDRAAGWHPVDRALAVLAAAGAGSAVRDLAALPLDRRNARLAALRKQWFGDRMACEDTCPSCGERVEFDVSCAALTDEERSSGESASIECVVAGAAVRIRPPSSADLAVAARRSNPEEAAAVLIDRCVEWSEGQSAEMTVQDRIRISDALAAQFPALESSMSLVCPACDGQWQRAFDIAQHLWHDISTHAAALLDEVDVLARAYGWTEPEILALSPRRRAAYLERVRGGGNGA